MKILFILFFLVFIVYSLTSPGETDYNYFTRLAESFINGKLYLSENPPWLNELIPIDNKYYVVYPPMPALILIPFVFIFGNQTSQTLISIILASFNVVLVYLLLSKLNFSKTTVLLVTIFFAFGTNHWYLASNGWAWFFAHITALFFLLLALLETYWKKRLLLIGFLLGASFWARTPEIFVIPFFYIIFWKKFWPLNKGNVYNFFLLNMGIIFFVLLDAVYNYMRFGDISPFSPYHLIPNIFEDPRFKDGFMNIKYIPLHIEATLFSIPKLSNNFPFLIPSLYSTALWFTSPALIFAFLGKLNINSIASWVVVILTFSVLFFWAVVGFTQFGYRFAQDVMPFLLILVAYGIERRPKVWAYLLVSLSIFVNLWGTVLINKFHIFTF